MFSVSVLCLKCILNWVSKCIGDMFFLRKCPKMFYLYIKYPFIKLINTRSQSWYFQCLLVRLMQQPLNSTIWISYQDTSCIQPQNQDKFLHRVRFKTDLQAFLIEFSWVSVQCLQPLAQEFVFVHQIFQRDFSRTEKKNTSADHQHGMQHVVQNKTYFQVFYFLFWNQFY